MDIASLLLIIQDSWVDKMTFVLSLSTATQLSKTSPYSIDVLLSRLHHCEWLPVTSIHDGVFMDNGHHNFSSIWRIHVRDWQMNTCWNILSPICPESLLLCCSFQFLDGFCASHWLALMLFSPQHSYLGFSLRHGLENPDSIQWTRFILPNCSPHNCHPWGLDTPYQMLVYKSYFTIVASLFRGSIIGAKTSEYLLEKSRIVTQVGSSLNRTVWLTLTCTPKLHQ